MCDGASENRSVLKSLCVHSARNLFLTEIEEISPTLLSKLPLDFKVAFDHPTIPGILIFAAGDMPHLIKKIVNAMERSGKSTKKTSLPYKCQKITLQMIKKNMGVHWRWQGWFISTYLQVNY